MSAAGRCLVSTWRRQRKFPFFASSSYKTHPRPRKSGPNIKCSTGKHGIPRLKTLVHVGDCVNARHPLKCRRTLVVFLYLQAPYVQETVDASDTLSLLRTNEAVNELRDQYQADLVVLYGGYMSGYCGYGYARFWQQSIIFLRTTLDSDEECCHGPIEQKWLLNSEIHILKRARTARREWRNLHPKPPSALCHTGHFPRRKEPVSPGTTTQLMDQPRLVCFQPTDRYINPYATASRDIYGFSVVDAFCLDGVTTTRACMSKSCA